MTDNSCNKNFCLNRYNYVSVKLHKIVFIFVQQRAQLYIVIDGEKLSKANRKCMNVTAICCGETLSNIMSVTILPYFDWHGFGHDELTWWNGHRPVLGNGRSGFVSYWLWHLSQVTTSQSLCLHLLTEEWQFPVGSLHRWVMCTHEVRGVAITDQITKSSMP